MYLCTITVTEFVTRNKKRLGNIFTMSLLFHKHKLDPQQQFFIIIYAVDEILQNKMQ